MSNYFDQFDGAQGNYFDQFDAAPESPKGPPRRYVNPNRGKSGGQLYWEGIKHYAGDAGLAARQMVDSTLAALGNPAAQQNVPVLENIAENRKLDPALRSGYGQAGYVTAALVPAVASAFVPGASTLKGAAMIGGGMGALEPTGEGDSRLRNVAGGAAAGFAGQAAFNTVARVAQPVKSALNRAESRAVQLLKDKGVALSVGQETGSRVAQAAERTLGDLPAAAPTMLKQGEKFRDSFTRATLKTIGESADGATPDVLGRARTRIGQVFDDVAKRYDLDVSSTQVANQFNALERKAGEELLNDGRIAAQIQKIRDAAAQNNGKLNGEAYKNIKTTLDNLSFQQNIGPYASELRDILDGALAQATKGTKDYARLGQARAQYRNLKVIADVADTTANGRVSPTALAQRLKSNKYTRNSMRFGKGDAELARLARAGSTVADRFPQSGTAPRIAQQLMLPAAAGATNYAFEGDLGRAAQVAGATWALPRAGAWALTNPTIRNYLAQGVTQPLVRNALTGPSRAGLGAAVPAYLLAQE